MGAGSADPMDDGPPAAAAGVTCSVCFDFVVENGDRATARLQCGHQFHLDCIGSAFNSKGMMQCPNCRNVEKGNWLFSNGHRTSYPDFNMDEWIQDDEFFDMSYSELPIFCPFGRLARVPFSYEEGEYIPVMANNELSGPHAQFTEYPPSSLYAHLCPFMGHSHQPQPPSSSSQASTEAVLDPTHHISPWNNIYSPLDGLIPADILHSSWDPSSQPNVTGADQASVPPVARPGRVSSDAHSRSMYMHSFFIAQGSTSRSNNSAMSSIYPHFNGNPRGHARPENHPSYQHHNLPGLRGAPFVAARRASSRGMAPVAPTPPSEHSGFYLFPPTASSSRTPQDTEPSRGSQFYPWERDRSVPFPLPSADQEFPWWGPPQPTPASDSSSRTVFWPRHSSERPPSQPQGTYLPRLHPFI